MKGEHEKQRLSADQGHSATRLQVFPKQGVSHLTSWMWNHRGKVRKWAWGACSQKTGVLCWERNSSRIYQLAGFLWAGNTETATPGRGFSESPYLPESKVSQKNPAGFHKPLFPGVWLLSSRRKSQPKSACRYEITPIDSAIIPSHSSSILLRSIRFS
jgi:hypothetical protein